MGLRKLAIAGVAAALALAAGCAGGGSGSGGGEVRLGIGGQPLLVFMPTTLADRLGYYREEGLNVRLEDLGSGAKALQALQGGSVDVVSGYYDHTIQMQAKNRPTTAFVGMLRYPSFVFAVSPKASKPINSFADLKGAKVGVTSPGSSTDFFLKNMLVRHGLAATDAAPQAIGGDASAVAAMENGQVDAAVMLDPAYSTLVKRIGGQNVKVLSDTRTLDGVQRDLGVTSYPASALYSGSSWLTDNPETARKLARAIKRALDFIHSHSGAEVAAKMPPEYSAGDAAIYAQAIEAAKSAFSPDGRISPEGAEAVYGVLRQFTPEIANAKIDVSKTFTNDYVPAN
ncbi:ABC transporter substrate-binding protein [Pseudonocardia eucalypti]|uniref:ABC transporter substrate-binding protein n=1 Tax=Pseudonocardia eucalypti TaxID=648755 RepID=A0ABP9QF74_9PSEU|nr:NitT/TauT family transport system substrate-binding protein [Pseudonocardia eucalypti]